MLFLVVADCRWVLVERAIQDAIGYVVDTLLGKQAALIEDVEQDETGDHDDGGEHDRGQHRCQRAGTGLRPR